MRKLRKILWLMVILTVTAVFGFLLASPYSPLWADPTDNSILIAVTEDAFGGPFTLVDNKGKQVTEKDYAGKYRLIYFGFTFCPAICPTELSKITAALNIMGDKGKQILPMFITIDPERDTQDKMASYVTLFHPALVGLTGTPDQIAPVLKSYKIYAAKRNDPGMTEYTMDHSSFIYFIAPDGRLLHIFKMQDTADTMAGIMTRWLAHTR